MTRGCEGLRAEALTRAADESNPASIPLSLPHREQSQPLLSMSHIYMKFEPDKYWYTGAS